MLILLTPRPHIDSGSLLWSEILLQINHTNHKTLAMKNTNTPLPKPRSQTGHSPFRIASIIAAGILGTGLNSQAASIAYTQDFHSSVTSTGTGGSQTYGSGRDVDDQEFGFGDHASGGQKTIFTTGEQGEMQINAFSPPGITERYFGSATTLYLDTASWAAGAYTVSFDVTDYVQGANDSHFGVYEGNQNAGILRLRVNNGHASSDVYPKEDGSTGTVSFGEIGSGEQITNGVTSISYDFTLTEAGSTGDYLVLGWGTRSANGGDTGVVSDSFNIDNITVTAVPEPTSATLLGLGGAALILRRRK